MDNYKEFAIELSRKAGEMIKNGFSPHIRTEWKEDNTPVTEVDKEINSFVINSITQKFPDHSILSEEGSKLSDNDYVWVCDPLDGTIPFSSGFPISVFTLSLVYKGEVILGVINDPYMERLVFAEKGKGAFLDGKKIFVSKSISVKNSMINIESFTSFVADLTPLYSKVLKRGGVTMMIRSTVYAGMLVAMGQIAGAYFGGKTPWDAAAVKLIVEEAGGKVTDLFGQEQRYDKETKGFIASNGLLHEELLQLASNILKE